MLSAHLHYIWENIGFFVLLWLAVTLVCTVLIFLFRKYRRHKTLKLIGFNFLLFVFIINTILFTGEFYFRFIFDYSDSFGFLQTCQHWLQKHVVYNADFFRDHNFSTTKNPGTTRIEVLGDSFAFGWGIKDVNKRFSNLLEKKLNQSATGPIGKYEVYTTATPGWESTNELQFLKERAGMFHFDTIILSYVLNDIYGDRAHNVPFLNPEVIKIKETPLLGALMKRSWFLEFAVTRVFHTIRFLNTDIIHTEETLYQDPQTWTNHQKTLEGIIDYTREHQQRLIVVIFPYLDLENNRPYTALPVHKKLDQFFKDHGVEYIDLYPTLKKYSADQLKANFFDAHPSELVHRIVADLLYKKLRP